MVISEIDYLINHIKQYTKRRRVKSNLINFPSKGYIYKEPYGVVLVMSPWNYPFQLSMIPLVCALATGNTVVLKPSSYSPNVSNVIKDILTIFDDRLVSVVMGGREANKELLDQKFDYIFFTGGKTVGKFVMEKASINLTPVTLELGGKSPCIIYKDANIDVAAKRIVWGKYLNAGQTCVAPDYVLIHDDVHDEFIKCVKKYIEEFFYENGVIKSSFPYIINDKHYNRLNNLIDEKKVVIGKKNNNSRLIEPIVMDNCTYYDKVMQEEIFGPIMPIISYNDINSLIDELKVKSKPLALYIFSNNHEVTENVLNNVSSGGACVNDVIMHLTSDTLPFGGVGESGMGMYHGLKSMETFTHEKSVFVKGKTELNVKYQPYSDKKIKLIKKLMKIK